MSEMRCTRFAPGSVAKKDVRGAKVRARGRTAASGQADESVYFLLVPRRTVAVVSLLWIRSSLSCSQRVTTEYPSRLNWFALRLSRLRFVSILSRHHSRFRFGSV